MLTLVYWFVGGIACLIWFLFLVVFVGVFGLFCLLVLLVLLGVFDCICCDYVFGISLIVLYSYVIALLSVS